MASSPIPAPEGLDRRHKALYRDLLKLLTDLGTFSPGDEELLERYVTAVSTARNARAQAGLFATGSMGQLVAHPGLGIARQAEQDAHRYAEALLLTPASRARAGIKREAEVPSLEELLSG